MDRIRPGPKSKPDDQIKTPWYLRQRQKAEREAAGIKARPNFVRKPSPPRAPLPGDRYHWGDPRRDSLKTWLSLLLLIPHWDPRWQAKGFRFDGKKARRAIGWIERNVHHLTGPKRGQLVRLEPFQRAILANAFGWVHDGGPRDGKRRFRKVLMYLAKKNGKSTILGAIAVYAFARLKEGGAKVLTAATHKGQARTVWEIARDVVDASPRLSRICQVWNAAIQLKRDQTAILEPISGEAKGEDGADCFFAILDELHRQNDTKLPTILDRGGSGRDEPMFWILTTADEIRESPCNAEREYALSVRGNHGDENAPGWNPSYLTAVYELDEGDDWREEKNWKKANPGLGTIKSLEAMRSLFREAVARDDARVDFQRLDLNLRIQNAYAPLKAEKWAACAGERDWKALRAWLRGRRCYLGADLATRGDMVSLVAWFPDERAVLPWYWACEKAAAERAAKNEPIYRRWRDMGALDLVTSDSIELATVVDQVEVVKAEYRVLGLGVDRALALEFAFAAQRLGFDPMFVGQGWATMTGPCDWLVGEVENGKVLHGNHPVLNWNAANLRFKKSGERGKQPAKPSEAAKIDGMSAWLTARAVETLAPKPKPPLEASFVSLSGDEDGEDASGVDDGG